MFFKHFSLVIFVSIFMSINIADAMKRSHDEAFESETDSSSSSTSSSSTSSSTSQTPEPKQSKTEPKTIELSLNPRLVHDHELRTFNSVAEACKAYGVEQEYSGGHPVSDEIAMYSLQIVLSGAIDEEKHQKKFKVLFEKYQQLAALWSESWAEAVYPSDEYKIREINKGDFSIADEFMELAAKNHFDDDIVRVVLDDTKCILDEQIAPRFFEALKNIFKKSDISFSEIRFFLELSYEISYCQGQIKIGFLMAQYFTNNELMFVVMHELSHAQFGHDQTYARFTWFFGNKFHEFRNELSRAHEREADSRAIECTNKPHAMFTSLIKLNLIGETTKKKMLNYFINANPDQLVKYVKDHWRLWFPNETVPGFDGCYGFKEWSVRPKLESLVTLYNNPLHLNKKFKDYEHPTSFERISFALSQKKVQDKQEAEERL